MGSLYLQETPWWFIFSMDNFDKQELLDVCINKFIPEFEAATEAWRPLPGAEREKIAKNGGGTLAKLLYAFVWQVREIE